MSRTEHAEVTEGLRRFSASASAHKYGGGYYVTRTALHGTANLGTMARDPQQPRTHEWVLVSPVGTSWHPTLGTALSQAARLAAAMLRDEMLAEEAAAAASVPALEVTTACTDCGAIVPTIRTGEGWGDLPRCPEAVGMHMTGHRVPRNAFDAALRLQEVQQGLVLLAEAQKDLAPTS